MHRCQHGNHISSWTESWSSHHRPSISVVRVRIGLGRAKPASRPLPRTLDSFPPRHFFLALLTDLVPIEPNNPAARGGNRTTGSEWREPSDQQHIISMKKVAPPHGVVPWLSASDPKAVRSRNLSRRMSYVSGGHGEQKIGGIHNLLLLFDIAS
jgi:hypothetical protein